jgi:hypothetical protein
MMDAVKQINDALECGVLRARVKNEAMQDVFEKRPCEQAAEREQQIRPTRELVEGNGAIKQDRDHRDPKERRHDRVYVRHAFKKRILKEARANAELIPVTLLEAIPSGKEFLDTPGALTFFREVAIFAPIP